MLGLIFLYYISKAYYELASHYNKKNLWAYALLGVASYYGGAIIGSLFIFMIVAFFNPNIMDTLDDTAASIMAIPIGLFICWLTYIFLKKHFKKAYATAEVVDSNILDEQF